MCIRDRLCRYPCRGYEDLYALGGPDCKTFQQAARELALADDKKEYFDALEAVSYTHLDVYKRQEVSSHAIFKVTLFCNFLFH